MMRLLDKLAQPPLNCFALGLVGFLLRRRMPRLARTIMAVAVVVLWLFSTPWFAALLLVSLQRDAALDPANPAPDADAIVVLSAGMRRHAPEFGLATLGPLALERVRYAATLHRLTKKPIVVSGGVVTNERQPLSTLMGDVLRRDYRIECWREERSRDTFENAKYSAELLKSKGIGRIYLVTHAWHMRRARWAFEAHGIEVVAAPTAFAAMPEEVLASLLPSWTAVRDSSLAIHEWLGFLWYTTARAP